MRQVAALEHAGLTQTAKVPPTPPATDIPLKPGVGLIASVAPTPTDRKS